MYRVHLNVVLLQRYNAKTEKEAIFTNIGVTEIFFKNSLKKKDSIMKKLAAAVEERQLYTADVLSILSAQPAVRNNVQI